MGRKGRLKDFEELGVVRGSESLVAGREVACLVGVQAVSRLWRKMEILGNAIIGVWIWRRESESLSQFSQ